MRLDRAAVWATALRAPGLLSAAERREGLCAQLVAIHGNPELLARVRAAESAAQALEGERRLRGNRTARLAERALRADVAERVHAELAGPHPPPAASTN